MNASAFTHRFDTSYGPVRIKEQWATVGWEIENCGSLAIEVEVVRSDCRSTVLVTPGMRTMVPYEAMLYLGHYNVVLPDMSRVRIVRAEAQRRICPACTKTFSSTAIVRDHFMREHSFAADLRDPLGWQKAADPRRAFEQTAEAALKPPQNDSTASGYLSRDELVGKFRQVDRRMDDFFKSLMEEPERPPAPKIPEVFGTEAILAWKRGRLTISNGDIQVTGPVKTHIDYDQDMQAECERSYGRLTGLREYKRDHEVPDLDCTCGFWAVKRREDVEYTGNVTLRVELLGKVIEGTKGYRASRQRILAIEFAPSYCQALACKATVTHLSHRSIHRDVDTPGLDDEIRGLCAAHAAHCDPLDTASLADVAAFLGYEVTWPTPEPRTGPIEARRRLP